MGIAQSYEAYGGERTSPLLVGGQGFEPYGFPACIPHNAPQRGSPTPANRIHQAELEGRQEPPGDLRSLRHVFGTATRMRPPGAAHSRMQQGNPLTTYVLVRGLFSLVWQVMGSNHRRLSRRFYRPL